MNLKQDQETNACLILTSLPTLENAKSFSLKLVETDLVKCASILPTMESIFYYDGKINQEQEHLVMLKSTKCKLQAIKDFFDSSHPYKIYELLILHATAEENYANWLKSARY